MLITVLNLDDPLPTLPTTKFPALFFSLSHTMESSELSSLPKASLPTEEAQHPAASGPKEAGEVVRTPVLHVRRKVILPPAKGKKRRRVLSSEQAVEEDAMYFSPLDSSSEVFFGGLLLIFLVSIGTRLHKIDEPPHVA